MIHSPNWKFLAISLVMPDLFDPMRWRIMRRTRTGLSESETFEQASKATRYTGFLIIDLPTVHEKDIVQGSLLYDDASLNVEFPPAKPLFNQFKLNLEKLTKRKRVRNARDGNTSTVRYSPGVKYLVDKYDVRLRRSYGDPYFEKPPPFYISEEEEKVEET